ncbi:SDR family NAD(P)-dependent oxidoreductase [Defluviimonas sp. CAU 1641]|uniref:SDR family NAD(P)-dependent oxidoreductase n=1 Tax=Defluviimonas salinarum TaxID=2992147 RepID=A0ABT3J7I9_9RHOB|nr:SDR family NAD(P)-dependent oxidoreductase [Defluviimonas salinarum]MCW3783629.1 SDR family NAD(P)-dependent oxidoreductase [Defluviimonas salinarum]
MDLNNLFSLEGRIALVTGGATGIGRMAAEALVAAGARVLIVSRKGHACEEVAAELNAAGYTGRAEGFAGDIGTENGVRALAAEIGKRIDRLHILVNNAGVSWGTQLGEFPYSVWDKVMSVNVTGPFALTQAMLPLLKAAATEDDPARVINTGSVMGEVPLGETVYSYAASKAAVHHMIRVLAKELAGARITVNAIAPGPLQSKMTRFAIGHDEGERKMQRHVPRGRIGRPDNIGGCLLFPCGRGGSFLTGAILPVAAASTSRPGRRFSAATERAERWRS